METADVVIVGAGFAGAATAYHLAQRGVGKVLLLEHENHAGEHASGRNASLTFQVIEDLDESRLAVEGARFIENPPRDFVSEPLLRKTGSLLVFGVEGVARLDASQARATELGLSCERISRDAAIRRVPALAKANFEAAFWNPHDGVVNIRGLLDGYLKGAVDGGVCIELERRLTGVRVDKGRVVELETTGGPIATQCLVNAAGAWAGTVAGYAGIFRLPMQPRRRHMYIIDRSIDLADDAPFVWHNDVEVYFRRDGEHLLTSPCDADDHPARPAQVDPANRNLLREKLARAFPFLADFNVVRHWACLRTFSPDERFVIGRDPEVGGFVWVTALGGHGMSTSFGVGQLGAAAICGDVSPQLERFSPARFGSKTERHPS